MSLMVDISFWSKTSFVLSHTNEVQTVLVEQVWGSRLHMPGQTLVSCICEAFFYLWVSSYMQQTPFQVNMQHDFSFVFIIHVLKQVKNIIY